MSEWLKEHAWKAIRASHTERLRHTLRRSPSATQSSETISPCASVNLHAYRGFKADVSQSYRNPRPYLRTLLFTSDGASLRELHDALSSTAQPLGTELTPTRAAHLAQDGRKQFVDLAEQADPEDVGQH